MSEFLKVFIASLVATLIATPVAIWIAPKIGAMDVPKDNRRVHNHPVPRFGGIAIYCGLLIGFITLSPLSKQTKGLLIGATLILILGIIDDLKNIPAKVKLLGQVICAIVLWFTNVRVTGITNFLPIGGTTIVFPSWFSFIVTILWIVGITNTINLIDGLDGLASGITFIACISIAYTANFNGHSETVTLVTALAGATLAFLFYNSYPAKIFMGDGGSMLLGFILSAVSLIGESPTKSTTLFATLVPIMILALPIFDTTFAIARRVANHKPIMQADKGHLHHRIMAMGFGQRRTVLALYSISAIMGIAGIFWTRSMQIEALLLTAIAAVLIVIFLGIGIVDKKEHKEEE